MTLKTKLEQKRIQEEQKKINQERKRRDKYNGKKPITIIADLRMVEEFARVSKFYKITQEQMLYTLMYDSKLFNFSKDLIKKFESQI